MEKSFWVITGSYFLAAHFGISLSCQNYKNCMVKHVLADAVVQNHFKTSTKENYNIKMEATKIQWRTSVPMVPVRAHLFTSHAYVSPCSLLAMWILIYIHIPPLPVALHPNTFPMGFCCLRFTAPLIDLASSVSWGDLRLGQPNLNPSLGFRLQVSNSSDAPSDYFLSLRK